MHSDLLISGSRAWRTGWQGFTRHGWLSLVASFIMAQALMTITIFTILNLGITAAISNINERLDVAIYFKDQATPEQIQAFRNDLLQDKRVVNINYISKEEARRRYADQNRNNQELANLINEDESFLPASLEVRVTDPFEIEGVVADAERSSFGELISKTSFTDNQQVVQRLRGIAAFVKNMSIILGLFFGIMALLIIINTIRVTIFARRREIEIMKLVGATDWYIRWPFLIEGIMYGVGATILSLGGLAALYYFSVVPLASDFLGVDAPGFSFVLTPSLILDLLLLQVVTALTVSVVSSYLATRRYLNV